MLQKNTPANIWAYSGWYPPASTDNPASNALLSGAVKRGNQNPDFGVAWGHDPLLAMAPTIVAPPDAPLPQQLAANWGDPLAALVNGSNGRGAGGGMGDGDSKGPGYGPGANGAIGGGGGSFYAYGGTTRIVSQLDVPVCVTGRLIVLEGLDGAGTTTQAHRLVERLNREGRTAHLTREPSDGPVGRLIREMLTGGHAIPGAALSQGTFGLLFAADRLDHLQREVEPAIARGETVVSDRWYHSSLAYQGTGADRDWIASLNARARRPELTIFLQVRPEVAAARRAAAKRTEELFEAIEMQRAVEAGYKATLSELGAAGERIETIDGELPEDQVFALILALVAT